MKGIEKLKKFWDTLIPDQDVGTYLFVVRVPYRLELSRSCVSAGCSKLSDYAGLDPRITQIERLDIRLSDKVADCNNCPLMAREATPSAKITTWEQ